MYITLLELYGSKYVKILIISHPLCFYKLMSKSTRKTSITLYVFLHGFDKRSKIYDKAFLSYSLPFTFPFACRNDAMCRAAVNHLFPLLRIAEIGSMTATASTRQNIITAKRNACVARCIIISDASGTSYVI